MTGFSLDSTLHMYVDPVLWNDNNQVTSKVVDIYTLNQKIDRAVFTGEPIMSQEVDTSHYNQIKGKVIESFFRDGAIYRTDVNGNGQTYYFMVEEDMYGELHFRFHDRGVRRHIVLFQRSGCRRNRLAGQAGLLDLSDGQNSG